MRSRTATILMTFAAVALVLSTMDEATPTYIWNASKSVPIGLYQLQPAGRLAVTELVAVRPPEPLATFLDLNGYLPIGVPMPSAWDERSHRARGTRKEKVLVMSSKS
jgi:type IV secretory pathway protease TraF